MLIQYAAHVSTSDISPLTIPSFYPTNFSSGFPASWDDDDDDDDYGGGGGGGSGSGGDNSTSNPVQPVTSIIICYGKIQTKISKLSTLVLHIDP